MLKAELQNARPGGRIPSLEEIDQGGNQEGNLKADMFNDGLKTELNPMDWNTFKFPRNHDEQQQKTHYSVIDILIGEPVVTFDGYDNPWFPRRAVQPQESVDNAVAKTEKSISSWRDMVNNPDPSKQFVPERIRIRSKYIVDILNTIFESKLKAYDGNNGVVMVRPFRALVHYDKQIRDKFSELGVDRFSQLKAKFDGLKIQQNNDKGSNDPEAKTEGVDDTDEGRGASSLIAYQHLSCLVEFMDRLIQTKISYLSKPGLRTIAFNHIWYLFKPGDEVVDQAQQQVYRVISVSSTGHMVTPPWRSWSRKDGNSQVEYISLHCVYIDFDGKQLGPVTHVFTIEKFDGEKAVTALQAYPIRFAEGPVSGYHSRREGTGEAGEVAYRNRLIERGKMFVDVASIKHMHYNGFTLEMRDEVDSQVMVDFSEAFAVRATETAAATSSDASSEANKWQPKISSIIGRELGQTSSSQKKPEQACSAACCIGDYVYDDAYIEKKRNEDYIASLVPNPEETNMEPPVAIHPRLLKELAASNESLADDDLLIMSYRVFGFVLRSRKWGVLYRNPLEVSFPRSPTYILTTLEHKQAKLDLTYLTPVNAEQKDKTAFDQLVLPAGHKDIVHCLVAQHFRDKEARVSEKEELDIVRGKGKGLIILLHGAPGVGKTTTAG
ncbi:aaa family atpase [Trichoderma cornu-damae]|uniref:Aaa family atpase n=1 Tax=Trichoderma cornu-damae TaxID=654480 RepID=A0A9P8QNN8_9HYPO|nr:aaa family atpase [Trichoderma cornu-damae]